MSRPARVLFVSGASTHTDLQNRLLERLGEESDSGAQDAVSRENTPSHVDGEPDPNARGITISTVTAEAEIRQRLHDQLFDCVVIEHDPPTIDGFDVHRLVQETLPDVREILVPREGTQRLAMDAFRRGITDYVPRDGSTDRPLADRLAERIRATVAESRSTPFERLPVGAAIWDEHHTLRRTNAEGEALLGDHRGALRGEPLPAFLLDDGDDADPGTMVDDDGGPYERVVLTRTADGRIRTYEWIHRELADGGPGALISTFRDVTERIEREQRIEELRRRLRRLAYTTTVAETADIAVDAAADVMDASLSGVHLVDPDGERLSLTSGVEELTEVFETLPSYERDSPPGTRAAFVWEVFESGTPVRIDDVEQNERLTEETPARSVLIHPIGEHGVFVISAQEPNAFDDTDDALAEILAQTLTTAMNRVKREQLRRERERRLSRLHDATRNLIESETDHEVAAEAAAAAEGILGFSITVVRLFDPEEGLVPVAESEAVTELLPKREPYGPDGGSLNWRAFERGEVAIYEDIENSPALDSGTGIRSLAVLPLGEYGTISIGETEPHAFEESDISLARILATTVETVLEAQQRNAEIRRQRDDLETQNERLERFANVVSHDLRNPLNVARGRLQLAREDCRCGASDHFEAIEDAHERMLSLIEGLLTLAREGQASIDREPAQLRHLIERCWRTVDTDDADLEVLTDRTVLGDRVQLGQLFENCFRNAVEHGTGDGGSVTVTVGDLPEDDGFYLEDDGPGIPEERRSEAFEFGYTTSGEGTGFGLAIVGRIVDAHGWDVTLVEGTEGGARFEFRTDPGP